MKEPEARQVDPAQSPLCYQRSRDSEGDRSHSNPQRYKIRREEENAAIIKMTQSGIHIQNYKVQQRNERMSRRMKRPKGWLKQASRNLCFGPQPAVRTSHQAKRSRSLRAQNPWKQWQSGQIN